MTRKAVMWLPPPEERCVVAPCEECGHAGAKKGVPMSRSVRVFMVLLLCDQGAWELIELLLWDHGEGTSVAHDEISE